MEKKKETYRKNFKVGQPLTIRIRFYLSLCYNSL